MRILVVYYSRNGKVRMAAERIAKNRKADLIEIKEVHPSRGPFGRVKNFWNAERKKCIPIVFSQVDFGQYDRVIICSPVLAQTIAGPIRTFLAEHRGELKEVEYFLVRNKRQKDAGPVFHELDQLIGKPAVLKASQFKK